MDREKIKALRKYLGISQEALAHKIGVTRQSVYNWEHDIKHPSAQAVRKMNRLMQKAVKS